MGRTVVAVAAILAVTACAWARTERETLGMAHGAPVAVAVSDGQTCIEVGDRARHGAWCAPENQPEAVWLGATTIRDEAAVVGQAPADVASVVLTGHGGVRELVPEESELGRFFVAVNVPPGQYVVEARRADGSTYVSGEMPLRSRATTSTTITP